MCKKLWHKSVWADVRAGWHESKLFTLFNFSTCQRTILHRDINPLPDDKILDWSKLKQSADNNFEFDVISRKFSKLVENTVGKGEIARNEQFLLFP